MIHHPIVFALLNNPWRSSVCRMLIVRAALVLTVPLGTTAARAEDDPLRSQAATTLKHAMEF
jgi:hypothetical protein